MFEVIKGFAGIEKGKKINLPKGKEDYMIKKGYVKPIDPEVKPRKKAAKTKLQTKVEKDAENLENK